VRVHDEGMKKERREARKIIKNRETYGAALIALVLVTGLHNASAQGLIQSGRVNQSISVRQTPAPDAKFKAHSQQQTLIRVDRQIAKPVREGHSMLSIFGGMIFLWVAVGLLSLLGKQSGDKILLESFAGAGTSGAANNSPSSSSSSAGRGKIHQAREFMQCAVDQASQAEGLSGCSTSGNKSARMAAANSAQNYANAARGWADKASAAAGGGPSEALDAAQNARNAAARAQAAADRAKYNAAVAR
jgi:hypothetical protein